MTAVMEWAEMISFFCIQESPTNIFYRADASPQYGGRESAQLTVVFLGWVYKRQGGSPNSGIERNRSCLNSTLIVPDLYVYDVENLFKYVANIPEIIE